MMGNMTLGDLIDWLENQDGSIVVQHGFSSPHSDRGSYDELAFSPAENVTLASMLSFAKSALGGTFTGWKGGEFTMDVQTSVYIGEYGSCGEEITQETFRSWLKDAEIASLRAQLATMTAERDALAAENGSLRTENANFVSAAVEWVKRRDQLRAALRNLARALAYESVESAYDLIRTNPLIAALVKEEAHDGV